MGGDICVTVGSYGLIILLLTYKSLNALILQLRSDQSRTLRSSVMGLLSVTLHTFGGSGPSVSWPRPL